MLVGTAQPDGEEGERYFRRGLIQFYPGDGSGKSNMERVYRLQSMVLHSDAKSPQGTVDELIEEKEVDGARYAPIHIPALRAR